MNATYELAGLRVLLKDQCIVYCFDKDFVIFTHASEAFIRGMHEVNLKKTKGLLSVINKQTQRRLHSGVHMQR